MTTKTKMANLNDFINICSNREFNIRKLYLKFIKSQFPEELEENIKFKVKTLDVKHQILEDQNFSGILLDVDEQILNESYFFVFSTYFYENNSIHRIHSPAIISHRLEIYGPSNKLEARITNHGSTWFLNGSQYDAYLNLSLNTVIDEILSPKKSSIVLNITDNFNGFYVVKFLTSNNIVTLNLKIAYIENVIIPTSWSFLS